MKLLKRNARSFHFIIWSYKNKKLHFYLIKIILVVLKERNMVNIEIITKEKLLLIRTLLFRDNIFLKI
jgi:hypothetical protein